MHSQIGDLSFKLGRINFILFPFYIIFPTEYSVAQLSATAVCNYAVNQGKQKDSQPSGIV